MSTRRNDRSPRGTRLRLAGRVLAALLVAWLVVDKVAGLVAPAATVGFWRTQDGERAYARAYADVMGALPVADGVLDVTTTYGTIRAVRWNGSDPGPPVVLLAGHSSGAPMWAENLPDWIG